MAFCHFSLNKKVKDLFDERMNKVRVFFQRVEKEKEPRNAYTDSEKNDALRTCKTNRCVARYILLDFRYTIRT